MSGTEQEDAAGGAPVGAELVDGLELELVAEVARLHLTVDELAALQPGEVLTLGRPLDAAVTLTAGGRRIGRGVLVDVEGELGVRLVALG